MSQSGGFDLSRMSTASKILLGAGILYLINLFLPWQSADVGIISVSASGMEGGIGIICLLLAIALVAWEGMNLAGVKVQAPRSLISAGIAAAIVVFTLLKILVDNDFIQIFAWIGLLLALVIGYGGWMRWQEHQASGGTAGMPPAPGDSTGGFTS